MNNRERDLLIESALTPVRGPQAGRPGGDDQLRFHPAWHDLDAAGRELLFVRLEQSRTIEAAAAPDGLSATARAVLRRLRAAPN